MILEECVGSILNLVADSNLTLGPANNAAVLCDSLKNALANPPNGIRYKLKTTRLVKLVGRCNQSDVTFIDKIYKWNALVLLLFGYRYHESKVRGDQFFFGFLSFLSTFLDGLGQFHLLIRGDQWHTTDLYEILIE